MFRTDVLKSTKLIVCLTCSIVLSPFFALAQKTIVIDDSLRANADQMSVNVGKKLRFGDYVILSSKFGTTYVDVDTNLFNTRAKTKSKQKFSFVLGGPTPDTARVNAVRNAASEASQSIQIVPGFSWGSDELLNASDNIIASININDDTTDTWNLFFIVKSGLVQESENMPESFLTNGKRKILLVPVTSNKQGEKPRGNPALGYELSEDGQALAAVQFYSGPGLFRKNKSYVYIRQDLEPKLKLLLAAAMTTVLDVKIDVPYF